LCNAACAADADADAAAVGGAGSAVPHRALEGAHEPEPRQVLQPPDPADPTAAACPVLHPFVPSGPYPPLVPAPLTELTCAALQPAAPPPAAAIEAPHRGGAVPRVISAVPAAVGIASGGKAVSGRFVRVADLTDAQVGRTGLLAVLGVLRHPA
jgi:hypothetical protein